MGDSASSTCTPSRSLASPSSSTSSSPHSPSLTHSISAETNSAPIAPAPSSSSFSSSSSSSSSSTVRPSAVIIHSKVTKSKNAEGRKELNGFEFIRALGEGGYAVVELHRSISTGTYFALKKMSKSKLQRIREYGMPSSSSPSMGRPKMMTALDKVRREIELMKTLWHPNIVPMLQLIHDDDHDNIYMVLECMHWGQVMDWDGDKMRYISKIWQSTPSGGLDESIIRKILADVLDGLEYLHKLRIIHRDLKPDNLLVNESGVVKIADFGVARRFTQDEDMLISETHGTYHFFAPEMCTGDKYDGFKADIWSVGVTLYILTFGVLPFISEDNNAQELFDMISTKPLEFPQIDVSSELKELISCIMVKDPSTRLTIAEIRSHPFMAGHRIQPLPLPSTNNAATAAASSSASALPQQAPSKKIADDDDDDDSDDDD